MSSYNNSLQYYKTYYEGVNWHLPTDNEDNQKLFQKKNKELFKSKLNHKPPFNYPETFTCIPLETTYPGLLLGSGITHGSGLLGELKLGFYFDYTTGLPVIPGSSVKGVLRSVFPLGFVKAAQKSEDGQEKKRLLEKANNRREYVRSLLGEHWDDASIDALEEFLFGSMEHDKKSNTPMSGRTIFHDAILLDTSRVKINGVHTFTYLSDDYITPHINRKNNGIPDALVNPIPIGFLKVLPGAVFQFQFELRPYSSADGKFKLEEDDIGDLFKQILLDIGIGAKTNVGYGQLMEPGPKPDEEALKRQINIGQDTGQGSHHKAKQPSRVIEDPGKPPLYNLYPREGEQVKLYGQIKASNKKDKDGKPKGPNRITFLTNPPNLIKGYKHEQLNDFEPGTYVEVTIQLRSGSTNEVESILSISEY